MIINSNTIKFFSKNLDFDLIDRMCGKSTKQIIIHYLTTIVDKNINNEKSGGITGVQIYIKEDIRIVAWITVKYIEIDLLHYNDELISDYSLVYDRAKIIKDKLKKIL